jgi:tetraacyldisaccharide 4'-kinase
MRRLIERWLNGWINRVWYNEPEVSAIDKLFALPLAPVSWLTALVVSLKSKARKSHSTALPPIVVVGNLTAGGTGKTPIVIALVQALQHAGLKPGVIMRGYQGSARHAGLSDEALLIADRTQAPVICNVQRLIAAQTLAQHPQVNVIVSDDGLQHTALPRDYEIVVIDGNRGFGNGKLLPAGPLREPVMRLASVDAVIVNGDQADASRYRLHHPLMTFSRVQATQLRHLASAEVRSLTQFAASTKSARIAAFAGIGNPERFFDLLRQFNIEITPFVFVDHHAYSAGELQFDGFDTLITTAKDAQNLPQSYADQRLWVLDIEASLDAKLIEHLFQTIQR